MGKLGGGTLFVVGILVVILGALIQSAIFEFLLDIIGFIIISIGIIAGIIGLVQMLTGSKNQQTNF